MVDNNTITGNQIGASPIAFNLACYGILSKLSPNCFVQCNNITRTGRGIAYDGNNLMGSGTKVEFFKNILTAPIRQGFVLMNGGVIGQQGDANGASGNVWVNFNAANSDQTVVGGPTPFSAISSGNLSPLYVRNISGGNVERILDNQFVAPSANADAYSYIPSGGLFLYPNTHPLATTCFTPLTQGFKIGISPIVDVVARNAEFSNIISTVITATANGTPQEKWMLKQHLHKSIRQSAVGANATVANFYTTQQNAEVAMYYEVDSLLSQGNTTLAQTKNNNATANNNITQTHKAYNNVYLSGVTSATDYATLQTLANLCPTTHGNAVFEARALLNMVSYSNIEYSDSCNEASVGRIGYFEEEQQGIVVAENIQANLFPNPNNGEFTLAYDLKNIAEATIQLYDVRGSLLLSQTVTNENNLTKLNATNFDNGIYFIKVIANNNTLWVSKFVINK